MPDILIRGMCKLESGKSYRALFKELNGKFVIVLELVESYADREVEIYPVEELPPHGDLIETKDVLLALVEHGQRDKRFKLGDTIRYSPSEVKEIIDASVPVVVPAERSGDDA